MNSENKYLSYKATKDFNHCFLPKLNLQQINTDNGRYYITPEGNQYQSVTTVLGKKSEADITKWKESIGTEEAQKIGRRASTRGSTMHNNIEQYLLNKTVTIDKNRLLDISLFKGVISSIQLINNIRLLEYPLYSDVLRLAGTVDCCAEYDGELSVVDFKSTTKIKDESDIENYWIQCSIYSLMIEEKYKISIPNLVIIMGQEFGKALIFKSNRKLWRTKIKDLLYAS